MKHLVLLLSLVSTFATGTAMAQQSCPTTIEQQRKMIIAEGEKAKHGPTSECFERLLRSEMALMKTSDRVSVIQEMLESAYKGEEFENRM